MDVASYAMTFEDGSTFEHTNVAPGFGRDGVAFRVFCGQSCNQNSMKVSEAIVYNRILTDVEKKQTRAYLSGLRDEFAAATEKFVIWIENDGGAWKVHDITGSAVSGADNVGCSLPDLAFDGTNLDGDSCPQGWTCSAPYASSGGGCGPYAGVFVGTYASVINTCNSCMTPSGNDGYFFKIAWDNQVTATGDHLQFR